MKKVLAGTVLAMMLAVGTVTTTQAINPDRGGVMGFIAGCCFGIRSGAAYNDGKEIHWREWVLIIPVADIFFAIWNGVDGVNGMTTADYTKAYGASFF